MGGGSGFLHGAWSRQDDPAEEGREVPRVERLSGQQQFRTLLQESPIAIQQGRHRVVSPLPNPLVIRILAQ